MLNISIALEITVYCQSEHMSLVLGNILDFFLWWFFSPVFSSQLSFRTKKMFNILHHSLVWKLWKWKRDIPMSVCWFSASSSSSSYLFLSFTCQNFNYLFLFWINYRPIKSFKNKTNGASYPLLILLKY